MSLLLFKVYFGIGAVAVLVTILWRVCRPSGLRPNHEVDVVQPLLSSGWMGAVIIVAAWPIAVPYIIRSYRRSREEPRFIREDEELPPNAEQGASNGVQETRLK